MCPTLRDAFGQESGSAVIRRLDSAGFSCAPAALRRSPIRDRESVGLAMAGRCAVAAQRHSSGCPPQRLQRNNANDEVPQESPILSKHISVTRSICYHRETDISYKQNRITLLV